MLNDRVGSMKKPGCLPVLMVEVAEHWILVRNGTVSIPAESPGFLSFFLSLNYGAAYWLVTRILAT